MIYTVDVYSESADSIVSDPHAQGVIIKATQGLTYVNPKCNYQWDLAGSLGRLRALYHYAGGDSPTHEAQFFLDQISNYIGQGPLIVDWEKYQNDAWGNTNWCREFVDEVHRQTGVWPVIYVQESALWQVANCAMDCASWIAKYWSMNWNSWDIPNMHVSTGAFSTLTGWQYTGGDMDRSIWFLDEAGWKKLGNPNGKIEAQAEPAKPQQPSVPSNSWTDGLGDTWFDEKGTFTLGEAINLRWGAKTTSALIATLPAGSEVNYDAYSNHDGFIWIRQPRANGQFGYLVCRDANTKEPFGTFK